MDKRWIIILVILILGVSCMYLIADSSTTVGKAITIVNKSVVTLPQDFTVGDSDKNSADLVNKQTHEKVRIKDFGKNDSAFDRFSKKLNEIKHDSSVKNLKNSTLKVNNIKIYQVNFQNITNNSTNTTLNYFYTCNHTFSIKTTGYSDNAKLDSDLNYIIGNMKPDFKQAQD